MNLTKLDVAKAHIVTAIRATFRGEHSASIYLLAASAREILTTMGEKAGVRTLLHGIAEDTGVPVVELIKHAHEYARFMKHADRDPSAILKDFEASAADNVLFIACNDYLRVTQQHPLEMQVFEAWWLATAHEKVSDAPLRSQELIKRCIAKFPGIRTADRSGRIALGLRAIETTDNAHPFSSPLD
jgi:hypothetical protein